MPDNSGETTNGIDHEIDEFLNKWNPLPEEEGETCPPDYILLAVSKERNKAKWEETIQQAATAQGKHPPPEVIKQWHTHLKEECEYCRQMVDILQEKSRPPVSMGALLAQASMEAQKQKAAARRTRVIGRSFTFSQPYATEGRFARLSRLATPLVVALAVVAVLWMAGSFSGFFKNPGGRAEVHFPRDDGAVLARDLKQEVERCKASESEERELFICLKNVYNGKVGEFETLRKQNLLTEESRGDLSKMLAVYHQQVEELRPTSTAPRTDPQEAQTSTTFVAANDAQMAAQILKNVGEELNKKKGAGDSPSQQPPQMSEAGAVRLGSENVDLEYTDVGSGVTEIRVVDKQSTDMPRDEIQQVIRAMQEQQNFIGHKYRLVTGVP